MDGPPSERRRKNIGSELLFGFAIGLAYLVLYLCLVASVKVVEVILGIITGGLVATLFLFLRSKDFEPFVPRWRWFWAVKSIPWAVLQETGQLIYAMIRSVFSGKRERGSFLRAPYDVNAGGEAASARRTITTLGVTYTPNSYVVDLDPHDNVAIVRQLVGRQLSRSDEEFIWLT